jgi:hypothetical protein
MQRRMTFNSRPASDLHRFTDGGGRVFLIREAVLLERGGAGDRVAARLEDRVAWAYLEVVEAWARKGLVYGRKAVA